MTARISAVLASFVLIASLPSSLGAQTPITVYRLGPGITSPVLLKEVRPAYTPEAMRLKIEGVVVMEVVVDTDGNVGDVRVTKSLDAVSGLDAEAVRAARGWLFKPAVRNGVAVPVYVTIELAFRLQSQFGAGAYRAGEADLVLPVAVKTRNPSYTPAAMREKLQGRVVVEIIVAPDGSVSDARVAQSLDKQYGLDDEALKAARQWTFKPATVRGQAVPVVTTLDLQFRLH